MTEHWLLTDKIADLIASLAKLEVALEQTAKDISAWKCVVITTHSALQSAIACHLGTIGNSLLVAK